MSARIFILLIVLGFSQAALVNLADLKGEINEDKYKCDPECGTGQCCIHYYAPIHGGKRALIDGSHLLPESHWPGLIKRCEPLKQAADKCLTRNTGEWCPCASGLTCKADGTIGLDAFFGKCV